MLTRLQSRPMRRLKATYSSSSAAPLQMESRHGGLADPTFVSAHVSRISMENAPAASFTVLTVRYQKPPCNKRGYRVKRRKKPPVPIQNFARNLRFFL